MSRDCGPPRDRRSFPRRMQDATLYPHDSADPVKPNEPAQVRQILPLLPLLEAVAATAGVMPFGVASIESLGRLFLWDTRPDASPAIMEVIASEEGTVTDCRLIRRESRIISGILIATNDDKQRPSLESLDEIAARLRARYHIATGPNPCDTDDLF